MKLTTIAALIEFLFQAVDKVIDLFDEVSSEDPDELDAQLDRLHERALNAKLSFREKLAARRALEDASDD